MEGTVKWFNATKGYGFILTPDGKEAFVHFSDIVLDGYKTLKENAQVSFDVEEGPKGLVAKNVKNV